MFLPAVRDAVRLKKESYWAFLACVWLWEEFTKVMENGFRMASGLDHYLASEEGEAVHFKHCVQRGCCVVLLTSTKDVVDRWREYFKDFLSPTDTPFSEIPGTWVWAKLITWLKNSAVAGPCGWTRSPRSSLGFWML